MHLFLRALAVLGALVILLCVIVRLAAADTGCTTPHCVYLPYITYSENGVDTSVLPEDWLARFNLYRAAVGLAPVVEDPALSDGAAKHANYMLLNPDEFNHSETPGRPGYTPEGDRAARQSNLFRGPPGFTAADAIDGWMESPFHRYGMLRPDLTSTGFALSCDSQRCASVLNVLGGLNHQNLMPQGVVYPGAHQRGVKTSVISWQFYPFGPLAELTGAALRDSGGAPVPFTTSPSQDYWNIVTMKPNQPLASGVAYTVEMHVTLGGQQLQRTWRFTTR